jgi:hypothetical protein
MFTASLPNAARHAAGPRILSCNHREHPVEHTLALAHARIALFALILEGD